MFRVAYQYTRRGPWHFTPAVRRLVDGKAIRDRYRESGDYFAVKLITASEAKLIHKRQAATRTPTETLYAKGI